MQRFACVFNLYAIFCYFFRRGYLLPLHLIILYLFCFHHSLQNTVITLLHLRLIQLFIWIFTSAFLDMNILMLFVSLMIVSHSINILWFLMWNSFISFLNSNLAIIICFHRLILIFIIIFSVYLVTFRIVIFKLLFIMLIFTYLLPLIIVLLLILIFR